MSRFLFFWVMVSMFLFPVVGRATMIIRSYLPAQHDRFYSGADKDFVGDPFNFSGVGSGSSGHWATLVSDNYFLSADHYHPSTGEQVTFRSTNLLSGPSYTYAVTGGTRIGTTDLWVGWFDSSVIVNSSIARYPVALFPGADDYLGLELYNYGLSNRVGRNVLEDLGIIEIGVSTGVVDWYDYDNNDVPSVGGDETYLQSGDSGAPSFSVVGSDLALIGIHWGMATHPAGSVDTFVPQYYDEVNAVLASRAQELMPVPEPDIFWYLLVIMIFFRLRRRLRFSV